MSGHIVQEKHNIVTDKTDRSVDGDTGQDHNQPHHGQGDQPGLYGQGSRESRDSSNIMIVVHPVARDDKKTKKGINGPFQ